MKIMKISLGISILVITCCCGSTGGNASSVEKKSIPPSNGLHLQIDTADVVKRLDGGNSERTIGYVHRAVGKDIPVLFVLGGPYAIEWFGRWIETGFQVVYVMTSPKSLLFRDRIADIEAVREHLDFPRISIFGHSEEAAVALEYAAAYSHNTEHLIWVSGLNDQQESIRRGLKLLAAEGPQTHRDLFLGLAAKETFNVLDLIAHIQARKLRPFCHLDRAEQCRSSFARTGAAINEHGYLHTLKEKTQESPPTPDERLLAGITPDLRETSLLFYDSSTIAERLKNVRILMIQGSADGTVVEETSASLARAIPDCEYVALPDVGHVPFVEVPRDFRKTVLEFLGISTAALPMPSILPDNWSPHYKKSSLSRAELNQEAAQEFASQARMQAEGMARTMCQWLGEEPAEPNLQQLDVSKEQYFQFRTAFCL